jgi:hypothetical protein
MIREPLAKISKKPILPACPIKTPGMPSKDFCKRLKGITGLTSSSVTFTCLGRHENTLHLHDNLLQ